MKRYLKIFLLACLVTCFYTYRNVDLPKQAELTVWSHFDCAPSGSFKTKTFLIIKYTGSKFIAGMIHESTM